MKPTAMAIARGNVWPEGDALGTRVIEDGNSANGVIFYGRSGEVATHHREEQELVILSLHLLQICLIYILQEVLAKASRRKRMGEEERRVLCSYPLRVDKWTLDPGKEG